MSQHKIQRLRTPDKSTQADKILNSTLPTHLVPLEQSGLSPTKCLAQPDHAYTNLVNEINNLYQEIASVKRESRRFEEMSKNLQREKAELQQTISNMSKDINQFKELYELQIANHQGLRKFYQQREFQWKFIVQKHKLLLEEYDRKHSTFYSKIQNNAEEVPSELPANDYDVNAQSGQSIYQSQRNVEPSELRGSRRLKKTSLEKQNRSLPRLKLLKEVPKEDEFYKELSSLYNQESKFTINAEKQYKNLQKEYSKIKKQSRNAEDDDFFDKIIRTTYYKFKDKCMSVNQIGNMDDMKKLKNANTSTPERLVKTLRKLNFQISSEEELKNFCEYIEKAVIRKYKVFRGDFAYQILVQKLKECQKLALSSDSFLSSFDKEKTSIKDEHISFRSNRVPKIHQKPSTSNTNRKHKKDSENENKSIELLLDSDIKRGLSVNGDESINMNWGSNDSSYRLRSQLPIDSYPQTPQGSLVFKFTKKEGQSSDAPLQ